MSDFLPENYEVPNPPNRYVNLEQGDNRLRILDKPLIGYEYWPEDDKPVRVVALDEVPDEFKNSSDRRKRPQHFWAFPVWNYTQEQMQIWTVKQRSILKALEGLVNSVDWGDPRDYDVVITKTKTGPKDYNVEYSVKPTPKKELDAGINALYIDMSPDMDAWFKSEDPFGQEES